MAFSPGPNDRDIPIDVFGSLVTETAASNLPLGVSPDNQDVEFVPGSVSSRRGLSKVFASAFGAVTVNYGKSYVDNAGTVRNLWLDSAGNLWVENVSASPGTYTLLTTTTPGSYAKSVTAFGREYIAISDGLHGSDIPLQYDGTYLDRYTQDGPGSSPDVACFAIPSVAMVATGAPAVLTLFEIDPSGGDGSFYPQANIFITGSAAAVEVGQFITVTGTSATFNLTYTVIAVYDGTNSLIVAAPSTVFPSGTAPYVGAGSVTISSGVTMTRAQNIVTVKTAAAHQLQVGYQAQITGVTAATIGTSVTSIAIDNENLPGLATVTTSTAHGLVPGLYISLTGVKPVTVGTAINTITRAGQVVTVVTTAFTGLAPGAVVTIAGVTTTSFNTTAIVATVSTTTNTNDTFTFVQADVDASDTGGTVSINWPIPDTPTPTYFEVVAAPTSTSFQIAVNYSNGTWTTGTVKYAWNGTFFVQSVIDSTTFTYQQYGPNATSSVVGTVTPYGQAAPGKHQMQVAYLTRQGYITRPSPPVTFTASGGQYISVSNIPIGPTNVIARVILFTGSNGAYFFYIPAPAQINGQVVSTSTVINDNSTISAVLDFSDNTLFASLGTSIQGNNLAAEIVIDSALGFGSFSSRLFTYGQRNTVQSLLNMGFDGGSLPTSPLVPTGWLVDSAGGVLTTGHYGSGWLIGVTAGAGNRGGLSQGMYEDAYGAPIALGNTQYKFRAFLQPSAIPAGFTVVAKMASATTGFLTTATIAAASMSTAGSFVEATFASKTPTEIPADFRFSVYAVSSATTVSVLIDEMSVIYSQKPYLKNTYWSYVNNPEGIDGVSGVLGPQNDTRPINGAEVIRNNLYLWTQDPTGRIHVTNDSGTSEPAGWSVDEVAANCGLMSTFALSVSQSDDSTGSGAEEWAMWASNDGAMIFAGGIPEKISQEIQPDWQAINPNAQTKCWCVNDYVNRVVYFGVPTGSAPSPNLIYPMSYRQLNSAAAIANNPPFRTGQRGSLVAGDNSRKWTRWNLAMNGAALMYRTATSLSLTLFAGASYGNVYTLSSAKLTDDDYGQIRPYYVTAALVPHDLDTALQLGPRKLLAYVKSFIEGTGTLTITALCDKLTNPWSLTGVRPLKSNALSDLEWNGGEVQADRIFLKLASTPTSGTDNRFTLTHLVAWVRSVARLRVRGGPQA